MKKTNSGFTLIELLVVLAILGFLSVLILASLNSARLKARDARRVGDLSAINTALQLYYDSYGHYPSLNNSDLDVNWGNLLVILADEHLISTDNTREEFQPGWQAGLYSLGGRLGVMPSVALAVAMAAPSRIRPQDPLYPDQTYSYMSSSDSQDYRLRARLENSSNEALKNSLSGAFLTGGVVEGDGACDKSLGYYCVSQQGNSGSFTP